MEESWKEGQQVFPDLYHQVWQAASTLQCSLLLCPDRVAEPKYPSLNGASEAESKPHFNFLSYRKNSNSLQKIKIE